MHPGVSRHVDCARLNARVLRLLLAGRWMRSREVARSYDRLAPAYDRAWLVHLQDTTTRLLDLLPPDLAAGTLLDLGCGTGFSTLRLAARYPRHRVLACDLSEGMITQATEHAAAQAYPPMIEWQVADMLDSLRSQPPRSAALVVAAWSLGYSDYRRVFRECTRVLQPGGCLAFVVNVADTLAPLRRAFRYCMQAHASELKCLARFPFPRDAATLRTALRRAGLRIETLQEGACPIQAPATADGRRLPWLLQTGTLAGFDSMLPLDTPGPVADTFEARLAADPDPIEHHFVLAIAVRP